MKKRCLFALAALLTLCSCGNGGDGGNHEGSQLTPEQNKAKMEDVAIEFANQIDADDFTDFIDAMNRLDQIGFPEGVGENIGNSRAGSLAGAANPLFFGKLAMLGRFNAIATRAADYAASDLYGVFTYTNGRWVETTSNSELRIVFPYNGETVTITVSGTGTAHESNIDGETYAVPAQVKAKMTLGSKTLVDLAIGITGVNASATTGIVVSEITVCGYATTISTTVTANNVAALVSLNKGNTNLLDVNVSGKGSKLVPTEPYDDIDWEPTIGEVGASVRIMSQVWVKCHSANLQKFIDGLEKLDDDYPWSWDNGVEYDKEYVDRMTKLYKDNISFYMNYDGSTTPIAHLEMKAVLDQTEYYTNWHSETYIVFDNDGSKFLLEEFFDEDDFQDLIDVLEKFADEFENKF
jgi:hypothetical protein